MTSPALEAENTRPGEAGRARRGLRTLTGQRGYAVLETDARGPVLVQICPMDSTSLWRRVSEDVFEQEAGA